MPWATFCIIACQWVGVSSSLFESAFVESEFSSKKEFWNDLDHIVFSQIITSDWETYGCLDEYIDKFFISTCRCNRWSSILPPSRPKLINFRVLWGCNGKLSFNFWYQSNSHIKNFPLEILIFEMQGYYGFFNSILFPWFGKHIHWKTIGHGLQCVYLWNFRS